jgi:hypothetical protein
MKGRRVTAVLVEVELEEVCIHSLQPHIRQGAVGKEGN